MVPLPVYLAHYVPNLLSGWSDFRRETALFAGWTTDPDNWTTDQTAEVNRNVQEAYRHILGAHQWTCLEQTTTLSLVASDYDYTLPNDFGSLVGQYMIWGSGQSYDPVFLVGQQDILMERSQSTRTGRPEKFAIRWAAQVAGASQRREAIFWPTPDTTYTLTYQYAVLTGYLSETNPYPVGGPRMTQLMFEACRAYGETIKNGARGDQWNVYMQELQAAVQMDKHTNTERTVGMMRGTDAVRLTRSLGEVTYYYGPDASYGATLYSTTA